MKLAIMQPYFFPYLGYFQLITAVDRFVFYDDVNYIKNGWINRNRLFLSGDIRYITVPLSGASPNIKINEVLIQEEGKWRTKMLDSIRYSYSKAPEFSRVFDLVSDIIGTPGVLISELAKSSIISICNYLDISVNFVPTSVVYNNSDLRGQERVLNICSQENARHYFNLPGGRSLYKSDEFKLRGIDLGFVDVKLSTYAQSANCFLPGLSIIDVLMFNSKTAVNEMLHCEVTN